MSENWSGQQARIFDWFENPLTATIGESLFEKERPARERRNLVVRARAGTGKTTTIIEGINRAPEKSILLCAFNKKIQEELSVRIKNPNAYAQTLHSLGYEAVRNYWERILVKSDPSKPGMPNRADHLTEQVTSGTVPDVIKRLISKLHTKAREINPHAREVGELTDIAYAFECEPDEVWAYNGYDLPYVEKKALEAMELAATVKPLVTGIDFADMIYLPVRNHWLQKSKDLVVVDEAQDMTVAQLEIAQGVCRGRIAVVGDDRQAIYGFRGADSNSLDRLKKELDAVEMGLTMTYRCGKVIVAAAQELVPDFEAGETNPDGEILTLPLEKLVETAQPGDFILSRLNAPLVNIVMSLLRTQKRARIAGKDVGAGLKALIKKFARKSNSVPELLSRVSAWESKEVDRKLAANRPDQVDAIRDKAETLITLAEGARSVAEIEQRIDGLFTDDGLGAAGVITCSSVHRSKGLEANRVFVLQNTFYPRGRTTEEENIEYVAITRAKNTLVRVFGES